MLITISACDEEMPLLNLGNNLFIINDHNNCTRIVYNFKVPNNNILSQADYNYLISPQIMEYGYDSTFLIVSQKPLNTIFADKKVEKYDDYDSLFVRSNLKYYWIVNKIIGNGCNFDLKKSQFWLWGPLNEEELKSMKMKLSVSNTIQMKSTNEFHSHYSKYY